MNVTPVFRVHLHPRAWEVGAFFLFDPPTVCCVEPALEKLDGEGLRNQMFGDYLALRCAAGVVPPPHSLSCQGQGAGRKPHRTCGLMSSSKYPPAIFFVSMERGARQPPSPIKCRAARARDEVHTSRKDTLDHELSIIEPRWQTHIRYTPLS